MEDRSGVVWGYQKEVLTAMHGRLRTALVVGVTCVLTAVLAACGGSVDERLTGSDQDVVQEPGPLRVGMLHSSFNDEIRVGMLNAFDLAVQHLNEAGGIFGEPVQVEIVEATTDPILAVERARQMVEVRPPHVIVGGWTSGTALPDDRGGDSACRYPHGQSVGYLSPSVRRRRPGLSFSARFPVDSAGAPVLAELVRERGFTNVGVIYREDAWGSKYAEAFGAALGRAHQIGCNRPWPGQLSQ